MSHFNLNSFIVYVIENGVDVLFRLFLVAFSSKLTSEIPIFIIDNYFVAVFITKTKSIIVIFNAGNIFFYSLNNRLRVNDFRLAFNKM